jgi:hypothetical protein
MWAHVMHMRRPITSPVDSVPDINVTTLKAVLAGLGHKDIKTLTSTSFGVVVPPTHVDKLVPELAKAFVAYKPTIVSTRELKVGKFTVLAKNREQQRGIHRFTFGRANEFNLMGALREWMADYGKPLNVTFMSNSTQLKAQRVVKVEHTGAKNIFMRHKADVHLITDTAQRVPLSIKDESAGYWESVDSYWGPKSAKFLQWALTNGQTALDDNGAGGVSLRPPIAIPATAQETRDVVFGTDLYGRGGVVVKKFTPDSFVFNTKNDTLEVHCTEVITTVEQVKGQHEVYFEIRNERNRNPKHLQKGLRAMAAMKGNLRGDKVFDQSDRNKAGI